MDIPLTDCGTRSCCSAMPRPEPDARLLYASARSQRGTARRADWSGSASCWCQHDRSWCLRQSHELKVVRTSTIFVWDRDRRSSSAVNYFRTNSVEVIGEPAMRYGARGTGNSIYVRDPEGNVIELKQMPHHGEKREGQ